MTVTDGRCGRGLVDFSAKRNPQNGILQRTIQTRTRTSCHRVLCVDLLTLPTPCCAAITDPERHYPRRPGEQHCPKSLPNHHHWQLM